MPYDPEPCLLKQVLGFAPITGQIISEAEDRGSEAIVEIIEGRRPDPGIVRCRDTSLRYCHAVLRFSPEVTSINVPSLKKFPPEGAGS
jgi:hypothetical protein